MVTNGFPANGELEDNKKARIEMSDTTTEIKLNAESQAAYDKVLAQYPDKVSTLLPLLRIIEKQEDGIDQLREVNG